MQVLGDRDKTEQPALRFASNARRVPGMISFEAFCTAVHARVDATEAGTVGTRTQALLVTRR